MYNIVDKEVVTPPLSLSLSLSILTINSTPSPNIKVLLQILPSYRVNQPKEEIKHKKGSSVAKTMVEHMLSDKIILVRTYIIMLNMQEILTNTCNQRTRAKN